MPTREPRPRWLTGPALLAAAGSLAQAFAAAAAGADLVELAGPGPDNGAGQDSNARPDNGARPDHSARPDNGARPDHSARPGNDTRGAPLDELIARLRSSYPAVAVCAASPAADLTRNPELALATGQVLLCDGVPAARASGRPAGRLLVQVPIGTVPAAVQNGWTVLVDADAAAGSDQNHQAPDYQDRDYQEPDHQEPDHRDAHRQDPQDLAGLVAAAALASWLGATVIRTAHPLPVRRALDLTASVRGTRPPARTLRGLA